MVRAKALFSILMINVLLTACSKSSSNPTKTPVNQQLNAGGPGVDPALNANQVSMQNSGNTTVRTSRVEEPQDAPAPVASPSAAPAPGENFSDYNYDEAAGTASGKFTPHNVDPLIIADAQRERQEQMAAAQAAQAAQQAASAPVATAQASAAAAPADSSPAPADDASTSTVVAPATSSQAGDVNTPPAVTQAAAAPAQVETIAPAAPTSAPGQFDIINPSSIKLTKVDDPMWTPGLPHEPASQPILTQLSRADKAAYTDGKFDSIMATLWNAYNSNADLLKGNEEFAKQVRDVHFVGYEKGHVTAYTAAINVEEDGNWAQLVFNGRRDLTKVLQEIDAANSSKPAKPSGKKNSKKNAKNKKDETKDVAHAVVESRTFDLVFDKNSKSQAPLKYHYFAVAHCADKSFRTCENVIIEVKRMDLNAQNLTSAQLKSAKPVAMVRIVNRLGSAIVTSDTKDQAKSAAHQAFNHLLSTSSDKVMMHTWAVAGGPSQFEVIFAKDTPKDDLYFKKALVIKGDLVTVSEQSQEMSSVVEGSQHKARDAWFKNKQVQLVSNDGGGDLNFKISFSDADESERISVTSNFALTRAPKSDKKQ